MKVEIKNLKHFEEMSEETNAFICDIHINGKKAGYAKNKGCGGQTDYYAYTNCQELIRDAENYFKAMPPKKITYRDTEFEVKSSLENFIDDVVYQKIVDKENAQLNKKLKKHCLRFICYKTDKTDKGYKAVGWKILIEDMLKSTYYRSILIKKVNELKSQGNEILNTNLESIL